MICNISQCTKEHYQNDGTYREKRNKYNRDYYHKIKKHDSKFVEKNRANTRNYNELKKLKNDVIMMDKFLMFINIID